MIVFKCDGHGKLGDLSKVEGGTVIHLCPHCYERLVKLLRKDLGIVVGLRNWKT